MGKNLTKQVIPIATKSNIHLQHAAETSFIQKLVAINEEVYKAESDDNWSFDTEVCIEAIVAKINELKEKYRLVLSLYLLEGYDHQEIASILNITENTSRTHLLRGKRILKEQLKESNYAARFQK